MLPIRRGQEPHQLQTQRWWRLARARAHVRTRASLEGFEVTGYSVSPVRQTLHRQQHHKCAYCDRTHEESGQPIEHFRPKKGSIRAPKQVDALRYWWLAWSWDNLLFACVTCNNQEFKGNHFPLLGEPLDYENATLGDEDAGLVDPTRDHPMDHIQFRFDGERWRPQGKTLKGQHTIRVFGLDRRVDLLELYQGVAVSVEESLGELRVALERGDISALRDLWQRRVAKHLGQRSTDFLRLEHAALIWDMFDQAFPKPLRDQHGIPLPRPGRNLTADPPVADLPTPAAWANFSAETIWALRAVGKRTEQPTKGKTSKSYALFSQHLRAALLALMGEANYHPSSAGTLCRLLAQPPITCNTTDIQTALAALLAEGRVAHDATADLWSLVTSAP